jgi:N-hydroxyarylamine O-acetyltransferase
MLNTEQLPDGLVERVLARLGLSGPPHPDLDGLKTVYAAWCRKVPFDNVLKRIHLATRDPGPLPGDDDTRFFESWLRYGTGGTCWAGNSALCSLLAALGFTASRGLATMLIGPDQPPNHGTVTVALDGHLYLVDASMLHGEPLPLDDHRPSGVDHPAWGVRCTRRSGLWHVHWRPLHMTDGLDCRIDRLDASRDAFLVLNEETRLWSPFNYSLYARLIRGDRVVGVSDGHRVTIDSSGSVSRTPLDRAERLRFMVEKIGIAEEILRRFPPDRPTPPPPGSRTAEQSALI